MIRLAAPSRCLPPHVAQARSSRAPVMAPIRAQSPAQHPQTQLAAERHGGASAGVGPGSNGTSGAVRVGRRRLVAAAPCACAVCAAATAAAAAGTAAARPRNTLLDRVFAEAMATGMEEYEASIAPLKRRLFGQLLGALDGSSEQAVQLLELGVGTGPNLRFYADHYNYYPITSSSSSTASGSSSSSGGGGDGGDSAVAARSNTAGSSSSAPGGGGGGISGALMAAAAPLAQSLPLSQQQPLPPLHITGLDPNPFMRPYLEESLARSGWPPERFTWVQGSAERVPLPDGCMDAVVCTLVLCSVPDVRLVLEEAARVLKPAGSLLFIEHTLAPQGQPLLRVSQYLLEPLQRLLADGCHLTRDPLPLIEATPGFNGSVEAVRLSVEGASLIAPHVAGIATRSAAQPELGGSSGAAKVA